MRRPSRRILLTGGTGIIGGCLIPSLLRSRHETIALVRSPSQDLGRERLGERLAKNAGHFDAKNPLLRVATGDTTLPHLGLSAHATDAVTDIIHCAGSTAFKDDEPGWNNNIRSAKRVVELARSLRPCPRIIFVSTASVCIPTQGGTVEEDDPLHGFSNGYIESKREAEALICAATDLDVVVVRPSIVIGNGIHDKRMARSILWVIPAMAMLGDVPVESTSRVDLVSVGFVADAIAALVSKPALAHRRYHISAGPPSASTCGDIIAALGRHGQFVDQIRLHGAGPWPARRRWTRLQSQVREAMDFYIPFLNADVVYSRDRLGAELGDALPPCPPVTDYVHQVMTLISQEDAIAESHLP